MNCYAKKFSTEQDERWFTFAGHALTVVTYSMEPPRYATVAIRPKGYRPQRAVANHFKYSEAEDTSDMIDDIIEILCDPDIFVPDERR